MCAEVVVAVLAATVAVIAEAAVPTEPVGTVPVTKPLNVISHGVGPQHLGMP